MASSVKWFSESRTSDGLNVSAILSKRRRKEESDEKQPVLDPQAVYKKSQFENLQLLCGRLTLELNDRLNSVQSANEIIETSPETVFFLSDYKKQDLLEDLNSHLATTDYSKEFKENLQSALLILYSTSLLNSRYGETVKYLETDLPNYLEISNKTYALGLIERARSILFIVPEENLQKTQNQLTEVVRISGDIVNFLNLFSYAEPENAERIKNIYIYTTLDENPRFPECKKLFPRFCQNLNLCAHEKTTLVQLKKKLSTLLKTLQKQRAHLKDLTKKCPSDREVFLDHWASPLWNCGAKLLENGFKALFIEKHQSKPYISQAFVKAVNSVSRHEEFKKFHLTNLLSEELPDLPESFISSVWQQLLGENIPLADTADLMKHILLQLPDQAFNELNRNIKMAKDQSALLLETFQEYLKSQFREFNLIAFKYWVQKTLKSSS